LSVAEVAEKIGAKPKNIAPWIYTDGKKLGVKKVSKGRFALAGKTPEPAVAEPTARKTRGRKSTKTKTPRGTLKAAILAVLQESGADGLSVGEVAERIGAKKNAVNVWFYTTGKEVEGLKKVGRGRFAHLG
jgi:hypothetical protein